MWRLIKKVVLFLFIMAAPMYCFASGGLMLMSGIQSIASIVAVFNVVLLITSLLSIKQFFFPGNNVRVPFHIGNLIFVVVFYITSLSFLLINKEYYAGYEQLNNLDCIKKIFFSTNLYSLMQWVILFAFVVNVLYINKHTKDYYL